VAVNTVDVRVALVTLVAKLEFPSPSPLVARVDMPSSVLDVIMGFNKIESKVANEILDLCVGANKFKSN
jgi:hypothetical protein